MSIFGKMDNALRNKINYTTRCEMNNQPIGFLDSGVGGFSVVKEVMKRLPKENLIFIGDSARNPYGSKTMEEVLQYTTELTQFLLSKNIKMLVIACNTATVAALDALQTALDIPVIGVIEPGSRAAVTQTKNHVIGVIGTQGTIQSEAHKKQISMMSKCSTVFSVASPKLVELVEKNEFKSEFAKDVIAGELSVFKESDIDTLLLGCTHYPLLQSLIYDYLGEKVTLIDPSIETAETIEKYLSAHGLLNQSDEPAEYIFYTTGAKNTFEEVAVNWLPGRVFSVNQISLEELVIDNG